MLNLLEQIKPWFLRGEHSIYHHSFIHACMPAFIKTAWAHSCLVKLKSWALWGTHLSSFSKNLSLFGKWDKKLCFSVGLQQQKKSCDFSFSRTSLLLGFFRCERVFPFSTKLFLSVLTTLFKIFMCPSPPQPLSSSSALPYISFIKLCLLLCCFHWLLTVSLYKNLNPARAETYVFCWLMYFKNRIAPGIW